MLTLKKFTKMREDAMMIRIKKFTKMRDDAMMIRISVKTTKMYANGFNTPKNNGLNSGILLIIILTFEILFSI